VLCHGGGQLSLAEIEAEIPDMPDEPPLVPFERDAILDAMDADFKRLKITQTATIGWRFRTL
jgi:hypothetical protein